MSGVFTTSQVCRPKMILGIRGLTGGLSNQRLAMLGLLSIARDEEAFARFPSQMVDFMPRVGDERPSRFLFPDLFDLEAFRLATAKEAVSLELPTRLIPFSEAFPRGVADCFNPAPQSYVVNFTTGLTASKPLLQIVERLVGWLPMSKMLAVQLRIERDWQNYLKRLRDEGRDDGSHDDTTDVAEILAKIRRSPQLDGFDTIWACCDEADLTVSKADLKRVGFRFGFNLMFQSDIPKEIELPSILLMRSMIDYSICLRSLVYVGLHRSTFSRTLSRIAQWTGVSTMHFSYSKPGPDLGLIFDGRNYKLEQ